MGVTAAALGAIYIISEHRRSSIKKDLLRKHLAIDASKKKTYHHPRPPSNPEGADADFTEGDTTVLEDNPSSEDLSDSEVLYVSKALGVTLEVARKVLAEDLPEGWRVCKLVEISHSEDELATDSFDVHSVYYFNFDTGESR